MTKEEYIRKIWRYYLRLEEEFYSTLNYVEFSQDNFQTYSKEIYEAAQIDGANIFQRI